MPRKGRLQIAGGYYHVLGRGLERRHIFRGRADKSDFLARLGRSLDRSQAQCLAWAIMSNHYHLLIRLGPHPLSRLMAPVLGSYGGAYNRRHQRVGYVFQNRFTSILCDEQTYLLELIRYIHLNPARAGVVRDLRQLDRYLWTGHAGTVTRQNRHDWHSVDEIHSLFGDSRSAAVRAYRRFIGDGFDSQNHESHSSGGLVRSHGGWEGVRKLRSEHVRCIGDERILGSSHFVERILAEDKLRIVRSTLRKRQGWTFERLTKCVCRHYEVPVKSLGFKARRNGLALAKSLICCWGVDELGLSSIEIAKRLGMSQQAVSRWVKQGRERVRARNMSLDDIAS